MRWGLILLSVAAWLAGAAPAGALPPATWQDPYAPKSDWLSGEHRARLGFGPQAARRALLPGSGEPQTWKPLVVLVEFPDEPRSGTKAYFEDMLFGRHAAADMASYPYPHPTMADLYAAMSGEKLTFSDPVVVDWVMAPEPYTYYTRYSGVQPGKGCYGLGQNGNGVNAGAAELVRFALAKAEEKGIDLAQFGVGTTSPVEGVFIVHAGPGAEQTSNPDEFPCLKNTSGVTIQGGDLWSHQYLVDYTPAGETEAWLFEYLLGPAESASASSKTGLSAMGVWAHEFGHMLQLPDLYTMDVADGYGVGCWDLMGYAIRSCSAEHDGDDPGMDPNEMSVWTRASLGWSAPRAVTENVCNRVVEPVQYGGETFKVVPDESRPGDYFLVEYRAAVGLDKDLVNFSSDNHNRVCIWHIDESLADDFLPNTQCCDPEFDSDCGSRHYGVAVVEADKNNSLCTAAAYIEAGDCMVANATMAAKDHKAMRTWAGTGIDWVVATGGLNDAGRISITVNPNTPVVPPVIAGAPGDAVRGDTWRYKPRVEEASGLAQWSLKEYPSGMTIDADTGLVSWRVPAGFSSSKVKVVVAVANCGGEAEQSFSLAVTDAEGECGCASKSGPSAGDALPVAALAAFVFVLRRRLRG